MAVVSVERAGVAGASLRGRVGRQAELLEKSASGGRIVDGSDHAQAPMAHHALEHVDVEHAPKQNGPRNARRRCQEYPSLKALPMANGNHIRCEKYGREGGRRRRRHTLPRQTSGVVIASRRIRASMVGASVAVWRAGGSLPVRLPILLRIAHLALERPRDHGLSPRGARRQQTVVADERITRRRNERREAREELEGRQDEHLRAPTARLLDSVADASAGERSESLERKRRARAKLVHGL